MQELKQITRDFILGLEDDFQELQGGSFLRIDTGEFFTKTEHDKYIQSKLEQFKINIFTETNRVSSNEFGIDNSQSLINKKAKKKPKSKTRDKFDNGEFNMVYRNKLEDVIMMKLNTNEKLVFYVLRDFVQFPTNCVVIKDNIPTIKELEPIIGLADRSIINAIKSLEEKCILKRVQYGHKKAIYINPEYYASGKDLEIETLKMFGLVEYDEDKVESYL